jgi:iron complex transport system permease protein
LNKSESIVIKFIVLLLLLVVGTLLSLAFGGSESMELSDIKNHDFIFWQIRLPKTITAIIAGATLSVAGLILQVLFRNPLAGPYVLGISSGASLMVAVAILAGEALTTLTGILIGKSIIVLAAIAGSFIVTVLILVVSKKVSSNVVLLLIGLMFSQICGAIQTALEYFSNPNDLKNFVVWGMGSLSTTLLSDLSLYSGIALIGFFGLMFLIKPLNALLLGENYAYNAGVDFNKTRFLLILISSVLTGVTTAFCGPIAFVGIAVPILSRMVFSTSKQQIHFASSTIIGSTILLFSDALSHSSIPNLALPINMITTFIGAPLVIYLMFKNKHW